MQRQETVILLVGGLAIIAIFAWGLLALYQPTPEKTPVTYRSGAPEVFADDPFLGPADAKTTVVMYSDVGCLACARQLDIIEDLHKRLPEVKFVWKDLPDRGIIIPEYMQAHVAARCAHGYGKFWEYARELLINRNTLIEFDHIGFAGTLGIPSVPFSQCMGSDAAAQSVTASLQQGREFGVFSTPYLFVNERRIDGVIPINRLFQIIFEANARS